MLISRIEIKNFRSIREASLNCSELTALLGRNGTGKSSYLYALDYFYDVSADVKNEDYFDKDITSTIELRVTFSNLNSKEKAEFVSYIHNDNLTVTKRISFEGTKSSQKYYAAAKQVPQFSKIRSTQGRREQVTEWNQLVNIRTLPDLTMTVKKADDIEPIMVDYESSHPDLCVLIEREEQFFGPASIGGGKLDKFTRFVLVPAVRDATNETTQKKGAISQLIDLIVLRKVNSRSDIREFRQEFEERIKQLYSSQNLNELSNLGASLTKILQKYSPGAVLNLNWGDVKPPEIPLPTAIATLIEDDFEGDISRKGHGLQRALILTLLQQLAITETLAKNNLDDEQNASLDLILAIEEPELFLHPSRCRYLSSLLLELSSTNVSNVQNQILYATHSPYFIDLHRFNQIRCVRKVSSPDSNAKQSVVSSFSLEEAANELARVSNGKPAEFTAESFKARAIPVMNVIVNEGFFADKVVVVEGISEVGILWKIQELLNLKWEEKCIVIVPANGKNNIDRPVVIFKGLGIPTYFIFDGDVKYANDTEKKNGIISKNHRYLRLANVTVTDFPETRVVDNYAVFNDNIEKTIEEIIGIDVFNRIRRKVADDLGYEKPSQALKNLVGSSYFVELLYKESIKIELLENIARKITEI
jgi:predicted ATP-dependent endonuclease of OLD family